MNGIYACRPCTLGRGRGRQLGFDRHRHDQAGHLNDRRGLSLVVSGCRGRATRKRRTDRFGFVLVDWDRLCAAVVPYVDAGVVPGVVMAVGHRDGWVGVRAVGVSAVGGSVPLAEDAVVRISSMTKPLVAVLALMLVEDGLVSLDSPIEEWLPELAGQRVVRRLDSPVDDTVPADRPTTLDDLLTMRLGFGFVFGQDCPVLELATAADLGIGPPMPSNSITPDEWVGRFGELPLLRQPGSDWMYDLAYGVLGVLIGRVAGRPLDELLTERVLTPLGMHDTGFAVPPGARGRLVPCYTVDEHDALTLLDGVDDSHWLQLPAFPDPRGGLVSTATDYLRFARMLLAGGVTDDGTRLLTTESVEAMTTDRLGPERETSASAQIFLSGGGWGYGVEVVADRYGWGGGLGTTWYSYPDRDLAAVLLTQCLPPREPLINAFWAAFQDHV